MGDGESNNNRLNAKDRRFLATTSSAFAFSLLLVIVLQVASFLVLRKQIEREVNSSTLVSAAGSQRMKSQRITLLSLALLDVQSDEIRDKTRAALQREIDEMNRTHEALIAGNPELGISGEKSADVRSLFFDGGRLDEQVRAFLALAKKFADGNSEDFVPGNPALVHLTELSTTLLNSFERLTDLYRDEGNAGIRGLERLAAQILIVLMLATFGIGLFIFLPVARRLYREFSERNQTKLELMEQKRELEQFATIVAHDLKAPLNNIGGFSQYLRSRLTDQKDQEAVELLNHIQLGVQRMAKMINELLQYARITKNERRRDRIDLMQLIKKVTADFQVECEKVGADIKISALPEIAGDSIQVEHLFHNLVSNAIKFKHPERSLTLTVSAPPELQNEDSRLAVISVEDNGKGFPPGMETQMFEPFKQLNPKDGDGIGFGLALCKKIVRRHGGSIWAEPSDSGGARFLVSLPLA